MPSSRRCCVPNCNLTRPENKSILHKFPNPEKDLERFNWWLHNIGGDVLGLTNKFIYKYRRVCHKHFESKYYTWSKGLTRNSVPTLHISDKFLPRKKVSSGQERSKPVDESQETTAPAEITTSDQVKSNNAVDVQQGCTSPENDATLQQSLDDTEGAAKLLDSPSHCSEFEIFREPQLNTYLKSMQKGSIVPDTFSWNARSIPVEIPQDEPEHLNDDNVPDNLSMYCDDGDSDAVAAGYGNGRHEGFHCDNCKGEIVGFRYTCVQCSTLDLCVACESHGVHSHHYMLRIPSPRPYNEIQTILVRIRRHLMTELNPIYAPDRDNEDVISVKSDIKSENEEELEQIDPLCENMPYNDKLKENSTLFSPGSEHSENTVSEEISQNNRPVLQPVKIVEVKRVTNPIPLLRVPNNTESKTPPNTAKRKIILSLAEFLKLKESNYIAKKVCLSPEKKTEEMSIEPTKLTTKTPKPDVFSPIMKFRNLSPRTSEQEKIRKELHVIPNDGRKEKYIYQNTLTPKASSALNSVVKLSKLPQSTLLQHERSELIKVRPLNSLQKITNSEGIR